LSLPHGEHQVLINCVAYENGKRLADISVEAISDYLERPECFVWVALHDASDEELAKMQEEFSLHPLAVEDARHGHQRPKVEEYGYGESVFAVMHLPEMVGDELQVGEMSVFIGRNFVLSVRNRSRQDFLGVRERCEREPEQMQHGAGYVFYALMDAVVDRYFPIIDALETELEGIETKIFSKGEARANIEGLYELKRKVTTLRHAVAPLMEDSARLVGSRAPVQCLNCREYFRDVYDHLVRLNGAIDTIRETIGTAIQVNLSMVTIEESDINKRLAAWAGIFAIATAFAGIWGMNFKAMPELDWAFGYPMALGAITLTCIGLYIRFKRLGWL